MASRLISDRRQEPAALPSDPTAAREVVRAARHRRRMEARRRRYLIAGLMAGAGVLAALGLTRQLFFAGPDDKANPAARQEAPMLAAPSQPASPPPEAGAPKGDGTFSYATTDGPVAGANGGLKKYR